MKSKIILLIAVLSFSLTSCIDLVEEIWVNDNQSGRVQLRVDAGNMSIFFTALSDYLQKDFANEISAAPEKYANKLKDIRGISNVKSISKLKTGNFGITFNFDNQKSLNKAWYSLLGMKKRFFYPNIYKIRKHKLKKKNLHKYLKKYLEENKDKIKTNDILKMIDFISIYHLPSDVKKIKNQEGTKLTNGKVVTKTISLEKLLEDEIDLGQVISF